MVTHTKLHSYTNIIHTITTISNSRRRGGGYLVQIVLGPFTNLQDDVCWYLLLLRLLYDTPPHYFSSASTCVHITLNACPTHTILVQYRCLLNNEAVSHRSGSGAVKNLHSSLNFRRFDITKYFLINEIKLGYFFLTMLINTNIIISQYSFNLKKVLSQQLSKNWWYKNEYFYSFIASYLSSCNEILQNIKSKFFITLSKKLHTFISTVTWTEKLNHPGCCYKTHVYLIISFTLHFIFIFHNALRTSKYSLYLSGYVRCATLDQWNLNKPIITLKKRSRLTYCHCLTFNNQPLRNLR